MVFGLRVALFAFVAFASGFYSPAPAPLCRSLRRVEMKTRYADGDDMRLSAGGSGGRYGQIGKASTKSLTKSQRIRAEKVDAYLNSDEQGTSPLIGKIIAGSMLFTIFGLLFAAFMYYSV